MNLTATIGRTRKYPLQTDYPILNENGENLLSKEDVAIVIVDEIENPKQHQMRFIARH